MLVSAQQAYSKGQIAQKCRCSGLLYLGGRASISTKNSRFFIPWNPFSVVIWSKNEHLFLAYLWLEQKIYRKKTISWAKLGMLYWVSMTEELIASIILSHLSYTSGFQNYRIILLKVYLCYISNHLKTVSVNNNYFFTIITTANDLRQSCK